MLALPELPYSAHRPRCPPRRILSECYISEGMKFDGDDELINCI